MKDHVPPPHVSPDPTTEAIAKRSSVELGITEAEGIVDVLIFIHQEAEPAQRLRLNDGILTLLHMAGERLHKASIKLGSMAPALIAMVVNIS